MQIITVTGRIGKDAESRRTQQGDDVCSFNVAVDQGFGDRKSTNWFRVSLWGKRGASLAPYLLKGVDVTVNGEFSLGDYQGKPQLDIRANDVALQGGRKGGEQQQRDSYKPPLREPLDDEPFDNSEVPF